VFKLTLCYTAAIPQLKDMFYLFVTEKYDFALHAKDKFTLILPVRKDVLLGVTQWLLPGREDVL